MGLINPTMPVVGQPHSTEDPKVRNALIAIRNEINGNLDAANLEDGAVTAAKVSNELAKVLGIDNGPTNGRGFAEVATSQTYASGTYGDLATVGPSVTVDVPSNGFVLAYVECALTPGVSPSGGGALVGIREPTDHASTVTVLTRAIDAGTATLVSAAGSGSGVVKSANPGGLVILPASAGTRTYTLKYARYLGSGNVSFANRKLWVIAGGPV